MVFFLSARVSFCRTVHVGLLARMCLFEYMCFCTSRVVSCYRLSIIMSEFFNAMRVCTRF